MLSDVVGFLQAYADDAEQAARAGLELVAAISTTGLRTRFGVATGLVVVGDLYGSGASGDQAIVGETPNLAASLFGIAEPNNVVIVESTRKRAIAGTINALIVSYYAFLHKKQMGPGLRHFFPGQGWQLG
jgi:class 3 adenylate cyclase